MAEEAIAEAEAAPPVRKKRMSGKKLVLFFYPRADTPG